MSRTFGGALGWRSRVLDHSLQFLAQTAHEWDKVPPAPHCFLFLTALTKVGCRMYSTYCNCGYEIKVTPAMCGSSTACPSCDQAVLVPSLSKLKRDAGESVSMGSTADRVANAVNERRPPFDGRCQICSEAPASTILPTQFRFLEERILTGREVTPSYFWLLISAVWE